MDRSADTPHCQLAATHLYTLPCGTALDTSNDPLALDTSNDPLEEAT